MFAEEYEGFKLYFAGGSQKDYLAYLKEKGCLRLASWFNERSAIDKWMADGNNIFVDSGAFSAHTRGIVVDVDKYISYLNANDDHVIIAAQVDKIPGTYRKPKTAQELAEAPELSWENYLYMCERVNSWQKVLPIYHQGENIIHLKRLLETKIKGEHIPYIGISPANDVHTNEKEIWLNKVFDVIRKSSNPDVKTHGFGITSLSVLERQPFYSADSTRWTLTAAYGQILTKYGNIILSDTSNNKAQNLCYMPKDIQDEITEMVEKAGFNIETLKTDTIQRGLWNIWFLHDWSKNYVYKPKSSNQTKLF